MSLIVAHEVPFVSSRRSHRRFFKVCEWLLSWQLLVTKDFKWLLGA